MSLYGIVFSLIFLVRVNYDIHKINVSLQIDMHILLLHASFSTWPRLLVIEFLICKLQIF